MIRESDFRVVRLFLFALEGPGKVNAIEVGSTKAR